MRKLLSWLLLVTLPLQGAALAWLDAIGPAHTHTHPHAEVPVHGAAHTHGDDADDDDAHAHDHAARGENDHRHDDAGFGPGHDRAHRVARHHHDAEDASVLISVADRSQHSDAAADEGGTVTAVTPALLAAAPLFCPLSLQEPRCPAASLAFSSIDPRRRDRPPNRA